jgi:hypothetical protein
MTNTTSLESSCRLVVYTVLMGDKEPLGDPLIDLGRNAETDLQIDYLCFTNNRKLTSATWQFVYIDQLNLPVEKLSRRPKTLPHQYLGEWQYSLYIDNIVAFKRLPNAKDLHTENPYLFKVFRHPTRLNPGQEAEIIVSLGYDDIATVCGQMDFYKKICPLEAITPLHTCTVILRSHHHPTVIAHGTTWWEQILCFSKRDQLSFDFSAQQVQCCIDTFAGEKYDNELVNIKSNLSNDRVKANFDPIKYAWLHRQDILAKENPQAHFLEHGSGLDTIYSKPIQLLEYLCHKQCSGLGNLVAPRRAVAANLGERLAPLREAGGNLLLIEIRNPSIELGFSEAEFSPTASALADFLTQHKADVLTLNNDEITPISAGFANTGTVYNVMVLFGLTANRLSVAFEKLFRLLNPVQGCLIIVACEQGDLMIINQTRQSIEAQFAVDCDVSVDSSRHDSVNHAIPNSLICFQWRRL